MGHRITIFLALASNVVYAVGRGGYLMATNAVAKPGETEKKKRQRSPNYPTIGLREAVERTKRFVKDNGKAGAMPAIATKLIGFASAHGQAYSALSALKKFGLLEEKDGRVIPTQRAMEATSLPDADPRRLKALRDAAISPAIYAELLETYRDTNIPNDETLTGELITYKGFNPNGVKEFLKAFRETIEFAGLSDLTVLGSETKAEKGGENVKIGDYVQWEPNGILQFQEPRRVRNISDGFVFVDGSPTGMPIAEVTIEKAPAESPKPHVVTPLRVVTRNGGGSATMKQDIFSVAEGEVVLSWPTPLSADSIEDLKAWLKIIERKISRSEAAKAESPADPKPEE
jgi:hypothetical protein